MNINFQNSSMDVIKTYAIVPVSTRFSSLGDMFRIKRRNSVEEFNSHQQ